MLLQIISDRNELEPLVECIQKAGDSERAAFGFLQPGAYREFVQQGRAVAAVSSDGSLAGYCLYGGVCPQGKIFQTYVAPDHRGGGVGKTLLENVFRRLEKGGYFSVIANVAADLDVANRFYEKMGFDVVTTKQGGKSRNRLINVRARELSTPSLLDRFEQPLPGCSSVAIRAPRQRSAPLHVLDLNVIFDVTRQRPRSDVARGVIAAGFENDVRLAITAETLAELERHTVSDKPDPILNLCRSIPTLRLPSEETLRGIRTTLLPLVFPEKRGKGALKSNDEADLRHLSTAICEGASGFVTSDAAILRASDRLRSHFGLTVLSPSAFGQGFDVEFGAPSRAVIRTRSNTLTPSEFSEVDHDPVQRLLACYHLSAARLREVLAAGTGTAPRRREVVKSSEGVICFASWDAPRSWNSQRNLHVFADEGHADATLAIKHVLERASRDSGSHSIAVYQITPHIRQHLLRSVAVTMGFYADQDAQPRNPELRKACLAKAVLPQEWAQLASQIEDVIGLKLTGIPSASGRNAISLTDAHGAQRSIGLAQLEDLLSPAIICTSDRPGVILPIWPRYAEELFHGAQQPTFLDHREASVKPVKAYIGGNYASVPEGGLAFFYESEKQGGRKAVTAVARILSRYQMGAEQASSISFDRGVLPSDSIEGQAGRRLKTVIDVGSVMLFKKPVGIERLRSMGCADGANFVTSKVIDPTKCLRLVSEGAPAVA